MSDFEELHDELRSVAGDLLAKEHAGVGWPLLARAGWTGLEVPEELSGAGATFCETAVVLEEIGRAATPTGCLGGLGLAVGALLALQPSETRDTLLTSLAEGTRTAAVAMGPFTVAPASSGWRVQGRSAFVPDADTDVLLLLAHESDVPVLLVVPADTAGLSVQARTVVDESRSLADVDAADVTVEAPALLRFGGDPSTQVSLLTARAATAVALDSLGLAEGMLARTVSYVGIREQFGRPIGSFQAVKHACADMLVQVTVARELVRGAVDAVAAGNPDAPVAAAKAKAFTTEAAVDIAGKAMQLHGGIGYTWESGIPGYLKRATLNRALFGSPAAHRRRIARQYLA